MKSSVENVHPTRVKLSVDVPFAELKPSIDEAYKHIGSQITVPGFRKGKVPASLIDRRVGRPTVIQEAVNNSLDGLYQKAAVENKVKPLGQPEVEITNVPGLDGKDESDLSFTIEVDCVPTITLPDYSTLSVTVDAIEVTDDDVEKELDVLRDRFGTLAPVDRPVTKDDFVTIDLVALVEDEEVDTATDVSYRVGSGTMLEGMDEALEGLSAQEETTFTTTLAGGEHAGKEAVVKLTVKGVKVRELAEADDDFAQIASEFDTLEELREDLREAATRKKELQQGVDARDKLLDVLLETLDIPVPAKLVEEEVNRHLENENLVDDDEHRKEVTESTERSMRTQFILDTVVEQEEIDVTQQEIIEYILTASEQYGMTPQQFMQALNVRENLDAMGADVARRKGLAAVLAQASVIDSNGDTVDMTAFTTASEEHYEDDDEFEDEDAGDADEDALGTEEAEGENDLGEGKESK